MKTTKLLSTSIHKTKKMFNLTEEKQPVYDTRLGDTLGCCDRQIITAAFLI